MLASKNLIYVILTIVAIALVAFIGGRNSRSNVGKPGTTFGQIYVDTPEVYSRERLVNDRFQQDAWLRKKLAEEPESGVQVDTRASSQISRTVRVAADGGGEANEADAAGKHTSSESPASPQKLRDTPIERFRDALTYREEVRNEILENQLDDRHDMAGNTLYRLKFDVTVVPRHDTSAYAMVEATIAAPYPYLPNPAETAGQVPTIQEEKSAGERVSKLLTEWKGWEDDALDPEIKGQDQETFYWFSDLFYSWAENAETKKQAFLAGFPYDTYSRYFQDSHSGICGKTINPTNKMTFTPFSSCVVNFGSKQEFDAAAAQLIARGIPSSYLIQETMEPGIKPDEVTYFLRLNLGLANFIRDLPKKGAVYTYAVTPKERVQRVSGETRMLQSLGLNITAEQRGVGASLAHSEMQVARANAIMRQPQLVGYSPPSVHPGEATMGWLIGPRFRIPSEPDQPVSFRHVPIQHSLTGIVSVPSWWNEVKLVTKTYWLDENGDRHETGSPQPIEQTIPLPSGTRGIDDILNPKPREPKVGERSPVPNVLTACEQGTLIIRGSQLWRSTVVTLGGQQADAIAVLPNMEGIIATFDQVQPLPASTDPEPDEAYLVVWTSEGEEPAGRVQINGDKKCE